MLMEGNKLRQLEGNWKGWIRTLLTEGDCKLRQLEGDWKGLIRTLLMEGFDLDVVVGRNVK